MGSLGDPLPALSRRPKILFIDAYDSFSNNITSQLTTLLDVDVFVLPIDSPISKEDFRREIRHYEAVVCGPGPGSPENDADVGLMRWLWELDQNDLVPVLGVCLGFQSLVLACGGRVRRLRRGLHGMVRPIQHRSDDKDNIDEDNVFNGVGGFKATLYHSLCADIGQDSVNDWDRQKWKSPASHPDIVPLAWVEEDRNGTEGTERILMALKHRTKPLWGLQYHPESVCTEEEGNRVVRNWLTQALRWNLENRRVVDDVYMNLLARSATRTSLLQGVGSPSESGLEGPTREFLSDIFKCQNYERRTLRLPDRISVPDIAEFLNSRGARHIILESANGDQPAPTTGVDVRGMFSIVAVDVDHCTQLKYHTGDRFITIVNGTNGNASQQLRLSRGQTVWQFLAEFHESKKAALDLSTSGYVPDESEIPFLGGFVGYITYEQGLSDINVPLRQERGHARPDICFAWVSKSVVIDHEKRLLYIQSLEGDLPWIEKVVEDLRKSSIWCHESRPCSNGIPSDLLKTRIVIQEPSQAKYEAKVRMCQEYIAAGECYELCLTDQTKITTRTAKPRKDGPRAVHPGRSLQELSAHIGGTLDDPSWHLYRTLRRRNPAPFASYIRLGGATLVSSSPERFLQYNRSGLCSMKPMKGTVKKSSEPGDGYPTSLAEAEAILHIPKEEAENLMIVDLVRHDLHGICGAGKVTVPELLKVEEYQTVYTMITTVQGQLPGPRETPWPEHGERRSTYSGLDVLSASLPPGSMTGAPKKRSCELLQHIEDGKERSLYSGVVGYMCVTGRGDWSVTIRSMFKWDDETEVEGDMGEEEKEFWHIGAGGAVTILSTPEGEREEMFVKLARPLSIFTEDT
ncbi:hypothetical protein N0V93_006829 [Gnomoniopsis smithogilvyi]|uniref:aminodeoxychorismate synthase n=1 Tax=Gnomoniopsis smithogilvyi TaxID=1191159 RepID=A0A9W9CW34_9PEZI|nr:hypothetical protein N0V93_006829 [Gnomoniopsis smithogilvyi]